MFLSWSQWELAVHLSLLSVANGWPLSIQQSQQLCQHFHRDIRRAILHLQLMLSWQPCDPVAPLHPEAKTSSVSPYLSGPWRTRTDQNSDHTSSLDSVSLLSDWKSEVDCIVGYQNPQPWTVKIEASLMDELPESSFPCLVGEELVETLTHSVSLHCRSTEATNTKWYDTPLCKLALNISPPIQGWESEHCGEVLLKMLSIKSACIGHRLDSFFAADV